MKTRVLLLQCQEYDPERIAQVIGQGMDELGVRPRGRALVKPNCVIAHPRFFPHAFTRAEFLDGLLTALQARGEAMTNLVVGERCGITIPTRYTFANAGYVSVLRRHRVRAAYFDENPQVMRTLARPGSLRKYLYIPQPVAECEFLVNAPKFKAHPWTKMTLALKAYIGLQDDAHRLIDHDHMLDTKIADLQEVISPGLIVADAIIAGEQTMLTPSPFPLGLIIMGTNPVAVDSVGARIVGLDPGNVAHIRISAERGIGPMSLDEIEIGGDVTLEQAAARAHGFRLTLDKVDKIFNGKSNLTVHAGPPPDAGQGYDYCWGGCPGSLYEDMHVLRALQPNVYHEIKPMHIVFGDWQEPIRPQPGERVMFIGDCARFSGQIRGREVDIPYLYIRRENKDPHTARSHDIIYKTIAAILYWVRHARDPVVRVRGCPSSMAETILYLSLLGRTVNPYLHPRIAFKFMYYYAISKIVKWWRLGLRPMFRRLVSTTHATPTPQS
jgi:uncharacterized protein (DUF362 family)